jgi:hypothetical protein
LRKRSGSVCRMNRADVGILRVEKIEFRTGTAN